MQVDDLRRELGKARDQQMAADPIEGRHATDGRVRRHRVQRVGIAAVLVLVLVGGGVFLATRDTDEQRVISGTDDLPHYLPDPLPEGPVIYMETPSDDPGHVDLVPSEWIVWTDGQGANPRSGDRIIRVGVITTPIEYPAAGPEVNETEVGITGGRIDTEGRRFFVAAVGLTAEQARNILADASLDAQGRLVGTPPEGFREVSRRTETLMDSYAYAPVAAPVPSAGSWTRGYTALVQDESVTGSPAFGAAVLPRSEVWGLATTIVLEPTEEVGVEPAYLIRRFGQSRSETSNDESSTEQVDMGVTVLWWVSDDVMLYVNAPNPDDARRLASSMREVDRATWDRFVASTTSPESATATTMTSGTVTIRPVGPSSTATVP